MAGTFIVQSNQDIRSIARNQDRRVRNPDLKPVMPSPYPGLEHLVGKDIQAAPGPGPDRPPRRSLWLYPSSILLTPPCIIPILLPSLESVNDNLTVCKSS